jgi:hypothetical protein
MNLSRHFKKTDYLFISQHMGEGISKEEEIVDSKSKNLICFQFLM